MPQGAQDTLPDWDALKFECRVQETNTNMGLSDFCYYYTTAKADRRYPSMDASFDGAGSLSLCLAVVDATGRMEA